MQHQPDKPPTIVDVARLAGVSHSTVSRVLTGSTTVSPATSAKVRDAIEQLGYVTHVGARRLAGGRVGTIGLLIADTVSPFSVEIVHAIDLALAERGLNLMLGTTTYRGEVESYAAGLTSQVDGLIAAIPQRAPTYADPLTRANFPLVLVDHSPFGRASTVSADDEAGTRAAVEHLHDLGHQRVGFIGGDPGTDTARQRQAAFAAAASDLGLDDDARLQVDGDYTSEAGTAGARALFALERPPTAIVATSDIAAFGVLDAAHEAGRSVPDDCSLVGFGDVAEAQLTDPPLTTVRQDIAALGTRAVELVVDHVDGPVAPQHEVLPTELVVRSTTAIPAAI